VGSLPNKEELAMFAAISDLGLERAQWNIEILDEMFSDDIEIANDIAQADYYAMVMALRSHAPISYIEDAEQRHGSKNPNPNHCEDCFDGGVEAYYNSQFEMAFNF
jgi:hypothetical protein